MARVAKITTLRDVKRAAILSAVAKLRDISLVADALGIGKTTLYRKLREYGISSKITPQRFRRPTKRTLSKAGLKMAYDSNGLVFLIGQHLQASPNLSLTKLAHLLSIERHTIEKVVRNTTGKTFRELRNAAMLEEATKLLRSQPQLTIKEIACKLGYSSQSALSRFLRANSGRSSLKTRLGAHVPKRRMQGS